MSQHRVLSSSRNFDLNGEASADVGPLAPGPPIATPFWSRPANQKDPSYDVQLRVQAAFCSPDTSGNMPFFKKALTCEPNAEVSKVHPKAMPVILTTTEEHDVWMRAVERSLVLATAAARRITPDRCNRGQGRRRAK
jgi:hypothetical protein